MIIKCNQIYDDRKNAFTKGEIYIDKKRFSSGKNKADEVFDYSDCYAVPAFIDLHTHGAFGKAYSVASVSEIDEIARFNAKHGVASLCAATTMLQDDLQLKSCRTIVSSNAYKCAEFDGAQILGIYLEGPFLSPKKPGAINSEYFKKPDIHYFTELCEASENAVKIVAIAPELDGAMDFIREASKKAICSIAHTDADYSTALEAFKNGAKEVTHLFNVMPPFLHRAPGLIGASFDTKNINVELIADGQHVHPSAVRAAFALFGDERIMLISDTIASGLTDGVYQTSDFELHITDGIARNATGILAGATMTLRQCVVNAVKSIGIPLTSAIKCASVNPAKQLGIFAERGSITAGKIADLVLFDKELTIKAVIMRGKFVDIK